MCISVDLPEPEGPITAVALPGAMSTETPRNASTAVSPSPYRRVTSRATTTGPVLALRHSRLLSRVEAIRLSPRLHRAAVEPRRATDARSSPERRFLTTAGSVTVSAWRSRAEIQETLERARAATEKLLDPISDDELATQASLLTSPLVWDYARIANFEELWLLRNLNGDPPVILRHAEVEEAFRHEDEQRPGLALLRPAAVRAYAEDVRTRVLEALEHVDLDAPNALLHEGFVFGLVVQNELQRQETMLQTLQLRTGAEYPVPRTTTPDRAPGGPAEIRIRAGSFVLGAVGEPWAYDSELGAHEVELRPFWIDRAPVTNREFAEFVEDKGYRSRKPWSPAGWEWREREGVSAPLYWEESDDGWKRIHFGRRKPLPPDEPVQHVSWYEADAYARWAGKRLPTEIEWERAAGWHSHEGKFRYPWGQEWMGFEASLERRRFSPRRSVPTPAA